MDQCLMHPYFASQDTLAPRARLTSFLKAKCALEQKYLAYNSRLEGNFRSARLRK